MLTRRLQRRLRQLFARIYLYGIHHLDPWRIGNAQTPLLLYCSHGGWSDVALALVLSHRLLRLRSYILLGPHQSAHFRWARSIGCITLPWEHPTALQSALTSLLPRLLRRTDSVLWVFATSDFLSVGDTDPFWSCTDIVRLSDRPIALAPAVWSYQLLQQQPACYLWIGTPEVYGPDIPPSELVQRCSHALATLYLHQQRLLYSGTLHPGYRLYWL
ncbi:MAG: hypothetical protein ABDH31_07025 [Chlorobiota bacterium]